MLMEGLMNKYNQLPIVLIQRLERPSRVKFSTEWVYRQWYTGMPVDYLLNLMDDLEREVKTAKAGV